MRDSNVAGRYAKALQLLVERQAPGNVAELEGALEDLRGFSGIAQPGSRFGEFLADPKVRIEDKRSLLRKGLDGRARRSVIVFADLLLRKHRLVLIRQVLDAFELLVEHARGVQRAHVVSAVALTPGEIGRVHAQLEKWTGRKIVLTSEVDPALVGGAYARVGDRIVDRSVKSLLEAVAHQLYEVSV
jgi:F-type H+-transporting ATPase subunit delta